jgi:hypothetical protein
MFLGAIYEPLEVVGLETFTGQRNVERTYKRSTGRRILGVYGCLELPARFKDVGVVGVPGAHYLLITR